MNSDQQHAVDLKAIEHGRTAIRDHYADKHVEVTVPGGKCFHVAVSGRIVKESIDHSTNWEAAA